VFESFLWKIEHCEIRKAYIIISVDTRVHIYCSSNVAKDVETWEAKYL
jgi:hypothetical protein